MSWKSEPVEFNTNGLTEALVRAFPGGSVTDSVMIGLSLRNLDSIDHGVLVRHLKAGVYTDIWQESVPAGKALQGPVPYAGLDAANESIVITLGEAIVTTQPRGGAVFLDRTA